jgi:phosphatidylserine/phosphatidylglycerophosphate/cardiolipin synthase-like enzyme
VRVLLDATWYNIEDERDNDEMVACINRIARAEGLPLTARCASPADEDGLQIHNKGVIVDGRHVLVSSINWNDNSPNFNREAGVIVSHPAAAAYFTQVFEADWEAASAARSPAPFDWGKVALAVAVIAFLLALFLYRRR